MQNYEKSWKHKIHLNRHVEIHKKSSHHCYLCEKTFPLKYYLTQHLKKAHKIVNYNVQMAKYLKEPDSREYRCQLCKKVFCEEEADRKLADHLVSNCNLKVNYSNVPAVTKKSRQSIIWRPTQKFFTARSRTLLFVQVVDFV